MQVTVTLPVDNVRWILVGSITGLKTMVASANWYAMSDSPLTVNSNLPLY